ncbi:MAG: DUF4259 domain-containing protein [Fimbriiglobus sp.]
MGAWGPGVYQSDSACDVLDAASGPLLKIIERATASDKAIRADLAHERLIAAMDLLATIYMDVSSRTTDILPRSKLHGCQLPEPADIRAWRTRYLAAWEAAIDESSHANCCRQRRQAITEAFDKLLAASRLQRRRWRQLELRFGAQGKATKVE